MEESLQLSFKPSIFERSKEIIISPEFLQIDGDGLINESPLIIPKAEISKFRYGIKPISGYQFNIGRIYCIDIKSSNEEIVKIRLKSIYGIRRKSLGVKYSQIVKALFAHYFSDKIASYIDKHNSGINFQLLDIIFYKEGIEFEKDASLIPWEDVETRDYYRYFSIFSRSNPSRYKNSEYLTDWNVGVLYSVTRTILRSKGI